MSKQGFQAFCFFILFGIVAMEAAIAAPDENPLSAESTVSLKDTAIQVEYSLVEPGLMSVEIIAFNGKTLGLWNWKDSVSGTHTRKFKGNFSAEGPAVFVSVSGSDFNLVQGLFLGIPNDTAHTPVNYSQSIRFNDIPAPIDFGTDGK